MHPVTNSSSLINPYSETTRLVSTSPIPSETNSGSQVSKQSNLIGHQYAVNPSLWKSIGKDKKY
jgi:hypothetical protein